jgi:hypothetical protein
MVNSFSCLTPRRIQWQVVLESAGSLLKFEVATGFVAATSADRLGACETWLSADRTRCGYVNT